MLQIPENIRLARKAARKTQEELANFLGIPRSTYANWEKSIEPDVDNLRKIAKFLDTTLEALMEDELKERRENDPPPETYLQKRRLQKESGNIYLVPFVDVPAQAGYTKAYGNVDYIQTLKTYPILPDIDPTGAVWRYFQVQGDSMEEEIKDKDVLLTSLVPQMDWPDIKDYYTHVIVTDEELLIKDILKESDSTIILLSQNPNYKARRVSLENVKQIWVMRRHIKNRAKKSRMYNLDEIKKELNK